MLLLRFCSFSLHHFASHLHSALESVLILYFVQLFIAFHCLHITFPAESCFPLTLMLRDPHYALRPRLNRAAGRLRRVDEQELITTMLLRVVPFFRRVRRALDGSLIRSQCIACFETFADESQVCFCVFCLFLSFAFSFAFCFVLAVKMNKCLSSFLCCVFSGV